MTLAEKKLFDVFENRLNEKYFLVKLGNVNDMRKQAENCFIKLVADAVCEVCRLDPVEVVSVKRNREYTDARGMIAKLVREVSTPEITLDSIGVFFKRNHVTVMNNVDVANMLCSQYPKYLLNYNKAKEIVLDRIK